MHPNAPSPAQTSIKHRCLGKPLLGLRAMHCALMALLLPWAAGCGPGVGGTGTGDSVLASFGASMAGLCSSSLAPQLACPGALPGAPNTGGLPTALVYFADGMGATQVLARFEGNRVDLDAPCLRIRFSGEWGSVPGQAERFYGSLTTDAGERPVLATLTVQNAGGGGGGGVSLLLYDMDGRLRFGPRLLLPVAAPPAPGACV